MKRFNIRNLPVRLQYLICIAVVLVVSGINFYLKELIGYKVVALLLLMVVSVIAMLFDIYPVMVTAVLSALIWNFFFIPPLFTFHIDKTEDTLLFSLYFLIALINTVLTFKIREAENKARDKEEKENVIRLYNTLFNSLSHELRTPISTIIGSLDTLKENRDSLTEEDRSELLSVIDKAGLRLNREVDNLLNMSRLESGMLKLNIDWCDPGEIIHRVIHKLAPEGSDRIIFTPSEELPLFRLDAGIIEQVIYNLVLNAMQHNPETTVIRIGLSHRDETCRITVTDNGKGFPEEEIQKVFDKFYRLEGHKAGGIGLGLSIVKGFAEAHHGTVTLRNIQPRGSEFSLEIPAETTYINNLKNE